MGLIDNINALKNENKSNNEQQKKTLKEAERKQLIKYQLLNILELEILEAVNNNEDLKNENLKESIIDSVVNNENISYLINKNYTRYFLLDNYKKLATPYIREAEKQKKKDIKAQKQLEKELEAERIRKQEARKTIIDALKIICMIILSPFLIIGFMIIACVNNKNFK